MTQTRNLIPAEIILTGADDKVLAFVNGEQVAETSNTDGFVGRIEKALRAAHVWRISGYVTEAGAMIAEGQMVVVA